MLFYHIIPAVHGTMCAQSNHAKHAVVIYGLPHEVYPAANVQRARGKAALCSCQSPISTKRLHTQRVTCA